MTILPSRIPSVRSYPNSMSYCSYPLHGSSLGLPCLGVDINYNSLARRLIMKQRKQIRLGLGVINHTLSLTSHLYHFPAPTRSATGFCALPQSLIYDHRLLSLLSYCATSFQSLPGSLRLFSRTVLSCWPLLYSIQFLLVLCSCFPIHIPHCI